MDTRQLKVRPVSHDLGSVRELTDTEVAIVSGGDDGAEIKDPIRPQDTLCWDISGNYRDIDD